MGLKKVNQNNVELLYNRRVKKNPLATGNRKSKTCEPVLPNVQFDRNNVSPQLFCNSTSLIDVNRPTNSLSNIFVMSGNIAQVGSFL